MSKHLSPVTFFLVCNLGFYGIFTRHLTLQHGKMYYTYCQANPYRINDNLTEIPHKYELRTYFCILMQAKLGRVQSARG